jgi:hypothetical protein
LAGISSVNSYLSAVAPTSPPDYFDPQPDSALIMITSFILAALIEGLWGLYCQTPTHKDIADSMARESVERALRDRLGVPALALYIQISRTPHVVPLDLPSLPHWIPSHVYEKRVELQSLKRVLVACGFLIPVSAGGYRRHPHFYKNQRSHAQAAIMSLQFAEDLTADEIESLLVVRGSGSPVPTALGRYFEQSNESAGALQRVLDETLIEMERETTGRDHTLALYLRYRYWDQRKVSDIARTVGYSREHLARWAHPASLELFRRFLQRRLGWESRETRRIK